MKKFLFALLIVVLGLSFNSGSMAQDKTKSDQKKETVTTTKEEKETVKASGIFNTVCPVSGEEIDATKTYTYKGVTYALCCNRCLTKFKDNPEKYISKLSDDGKSLKKKK